jgi:hypothetical protein
VKAVKDKVDAIGRLSLSPRPGLLRSRSSPFRAAARLVTGASRLSGMGAPTGTAIDQLADLRAFAEPLFAKMKDIVERRPRTEPAAGRWGVPYIK